MLPSVSVVSRSACRLAASGFAVRQSSRALGGFVAAVGFRRSALAAEFARRWAVQLPAACSGCVIRGLCRRFTSGLPVCGRFWRGLGMVVVGFSGSRRLPRSFAGQVQMVVQSVSASGRGVAVGCASGLDSFVRSACPSAHVFRASSFFPSALVARSARMVQFVVASGAGAGLVVFPGAVCPAGLLPSSSVSHCFCGLGSGSWATAAYAAGLGLPVVVFGLETSQLPWGKWRSAGSGVWKSGFLFSHPKQKKLF